MPKCSAKSITLHNLKIIVTIIYFIIVISIIFLKLELFSKVASTIILQRILFSELLYDLVKI